MPTYVTKAELAEAKKALNERITSQGMRILACETRLDALEKRVGDLETQPEEPPAEEPPTEPADGKVLFVDKFKSLPQAHKSGGGWYNQSNPERSKVVTNGARFEIRQGDVESDTKLEMAELSGQNYSAGSNLWICHEFMWPTDDSANPSWETVHEWHDADNNGLDGASYSPAVALFRYNGQLSFRNGKGSPSYWSGPQVTKGTWNQLLYRVLFDTKAGEIEAYWNGQLVADFKGLTTNTGKSYLKLGCYRARGSSGTSATEHRKFAVATSRAAALAA